MEFKNMQQVTKSLEVTQKAQPHGSMTTGGQQIIQSSQALRKPIDSVSKAMKIKSAMRSASPTLGEWTRNEQGKMYRPITYPTLTDEQKAFVEYYSKPAPDDVIKFQLLRMATELRLTDSDALSKYRIEDYIMRLRGKTELQLFDMAEWFIANHKNDFFPKWRDMNEYFQSVKRFYKT